MTKELRKANMNRYELDSKYVKDMCRENLISYKKQRNFYNKLYKKKEKIYYERLSLNNITDNKKF